MFTATSTAIVKIKNLSYIGAFLLSMEFIGITAISMSVLTLFILIDIVTGIICSGTLHGWRTINSSVLQTGVLAKLLLVLVPLVMALTGKGIGLEADILAQSGMNVLILSEAYSIIGNIHSVRTGKEKIEFDAVAFVLMKIKNVLKKIIMEDK